ncbi:MAG: hypothetical protein CVU84_06305 [Firmicutes bacterium HGW-Firmicutes-1]|jgi:uncharacterized protein YhaN|nr:MAG: hypothetical protein CVU84_06305 [Firmicutes bacterium HGW-Firmicutes-1]
MIIKKLMIKSFGKFQNTTIDLQDGLNLILGENEAGKSTIHQFIEGMFYGFYKPNIKNKKSSETYEKYFPWDNVNDYSGVMIIQDEKELRIERNFMKNRDSVHIFNNVTGENVTDEYPYDSVTKTYQPALKHLNMNLAAYQNTVSITQMKSKTTEELVGEIKDNIINLGDTKRVDVSVNNILRILSEKKAAIGTERSKKSNYGKTKETIDYIESEKEDTSKIWEEIKQLKVNENKLAFDIQALENKKQHIENKMLFLKRQDGEEAYQKVKQIREEIEGLKQKVLKYNAFAEVSKEEVNDVVIKINNMDFYKKAFEEEQEKISEMIQKKIVVENEIIQIDSVIIEIGASEQISRDVYKYEEFENGKKYTGQGFDPEKVEQQKKAIAKCKGKMNNTRLLYILTLVLTVFLGAIKLFETMGSIWINNNSGMLGLLTSIKGLTLVTLIGLLLMLVTTLLLWTRNKNRRIELRDLENQMKLMLESESASINRVKEIEERQEALLSKHECENIDALKALRDRMVKEELLYQDNYMKARQLEEEMEILENRINSENEKLRGQQRIIEEDSNKIRELMVKLEVNSEEELKDVLGEYDLFKAIEQEIQSKKYLLTEMTKGKSYLSMEGFREEDVGEVVSDDREDKSLLTTENEEVDVEVSYDELEEELKNINNQIVQENKEVSIISTSIATKENRVRSSSQIEEELNKNYEEFEKMTFKLNSYNIIEDAIRHISRNIQDNFAPTLNEKISKVISIATDYKYTDVKVSSNMEISVVDNELNKLVRVDDLSAGTIDLMYFALRLSIAEVVNNCQAVPIILDDSFVQYDERRLIKMLEYLSKLNRQVILFTCHKREAKVIKRIVEDLHVVNL